MAKKVGKHSAAANDFLEPKPVVITSSTDVGTGRAVNNGAIDIVWSLPAGSPEATLYTITPSPSVAGSPWTTTATSYRAQGLASATSYTFSIVASNAAGAAAATSTSAVTATTIPSAPTSVSVASTVTNTDRVTWLAPTTDGGKAVSSYTIVSSDGPSYANSVSPKDIAETGNTSQNYTIYAINANGTSAGAITNTVTTFTPPHFPPFFPPHFPPFFPPFFPPHFPPFFPPFFPPHFPPFFPPFFPPHFPPFFPPYFPAANTCNTPGCSQYSGSSAGCANCSNCVNNFGGYWTGSACLT